MHRRPRLFLLACAALSLAACNNNDGDDGRGGSCDALVAGDIVITEVMANPAGPDTGNEWFELYNATTNDIGLAGAELVVSQEDGSDDKRHPISALLIAAGEYSVVGSVINDAALLPEHIDYGYARDLGDLRNMAGRLVVECEGSVIDEIVYADPGDGTSRIYTGGRTPDASGNDDLNFWCDSITPFGAEEFATPGAQNDVCQGVGSPTECEEGGVMRAVVPPVAGDVVITEFMPNPMAAPDDTGEWFEVYFASAADLNGLEVGTVDGEVRDTILDVPCISVPAGGRIVVARTNDPTTNGGLPRVDGLFDFSLGNSSGELFVGRGGEIFDHIAWTGSSDGEATQLDPDFLSAEANDDPGVFCDAVTPYGDGDLGTPGEANDQCMIAPPAGMCFDGGALRAAVAPGPGDIVITEFHANPDAVEDADGEFIEVRANASFDLNGLQLGRDAGEVGDVVEVEDCIAMSAGDYALLARDRDPAVNGGLPEVDATFGFSLINSEGRVWIGIGDAELDVITWTSSSGGAATQLDVAFSDPSDNDDEANWCDAIDAYGLGDLGTPGSANVACGGGPSGTCSDGGADRDLVAPSMGDLVITEVMANPDAVADSEGEWLEVKNISGGAVDLNGLQMGFDDGASSAELPAGGDCLSVAADGYAVLAGNGDSAANGGLPDTAFEIGFSSIGNTGRMIWIGYAETHWDELTYEDALTGASWSVDPAHETVTGNDDVANLCAADMPYGDGDLGSPGAAGPSCAGLGDGMCLDGGNPRAIVPPVAGDLVINEWMANPAVVGDPQGEWFELFVGAAVDLNDLQLSRGGTGNWTLSSTLTSANCLSVAAGTYLLIARNAMAATNGGLPTVDFEVTNFALTNVNYGIAVGLDGTFLDEIDYAASSSGLATQVDPGSQTPVGNDSAANRCNATMAYGDGDTGTPGAANPPC